MDKLSDLAEALEIEPGRMVYAARRMETCCRRRIFRDPGKDKNRVVYDPQEPLRSLQQQILRRILLPNIERSSHSHGGVRGRSILSSVRAHLKQKFAFSCDISSFYPSIHFNRVRRLFLQFGYSRILSDLLTRLCTIDYHVPPGFITSPILADRVVQQVDVRLAALTRAIGLGYSRFVDDITISASFNLQDSGIPSLVKQIVDETGFALNPKKTRMGDLSKGFTILGLRIIKGGTDVAKDHHLENLRRLHDLASLARGEPFEGPYFTQQQMFGRIQFACYVNPKYRKILIPLWNALKWQTIEEEAVNRGIEIS